MNYGVTYGDEKFANQRHIAFNSLKKYLSSRLFDEKWLKNYQKIYPDIIYPNARGGGFWIYKSLILNEMFQSIKDGDGVLWMDAGCELIDDPTILFNIARENNGFCISQQEHKNKKFIKSETFKIMDCEEEKYWEGWQCDAATLVLTKTSETEKFVKDFLKYSSNPLAITDEQIMEQKSEFIDHRHDQAILSLLSIKYEIPRFRSPTQFGNGQVNILNGYEKEVSSKYGQIFNHTRVRY